MDNKKIGSFISTMRKEKGMTQKDLAEKLNDFILVLLSSTFILSIFICMLCNFVISGSFDWSLYAVGGEAMAWIIIAPFLLFKEHRVITSLIGLSIGILPLLLLIEHLCPAKGWVFPLALPIVVISLISLWISTILFIYTNFNRYFLVSFEIVLFGVIVDLGVNIVVNHYLGKNLICAINLLKPAVFIVIAIIVAIVGNVQKQKS